MPITDPTALATLGNRLHGGSLIEQAMATRTTVMADLDQLKARKLLGDEDIANLNALIAEAHRVLEARTLATSEARVQTHTKTTALRDLKADRTALLKCFQSAFWDTPELSEFQRNTYQGKSTAKFCADLSRKLTFAKKHVEVLKTVGADLEFLTGMETKLRALEASAGSQEAILNALPEGTEQWNICKGKLYLALKRINNSGRALYSKDPVSAAKYTLTILRRRDKTKNTPTTETPTSEVTSPNIATTKAA